MSDPPAPETLLKAALVRRAMTDVTRIIRLREDKPALQNLLQKGSMGDDLWNSLLAAEKELEAEILEVAAEANAYVEGWGSVIFQTATEMMHNEKMRSLVEQIPAIRAEAGTFCDAWSSGHGPIFCSALQNASMASTRYPSLLSNLLRLPLLPLLPRHQPLHGLLHQSPPSRMVLHRPVLPQTVARSATATGQKSRHLHLHVHLRNL